MSARGIARRPTHVGYATPTNAPIYVDSDTNQLKYLPYGEGTTEVVVGGGDAVLPINLATQVTGDLPYANLTPSTAASQLLGRGSAAGAGDWQPITLGTNLSMSGTTLNAASGTSVYGGAPSLFAGDGAIDPNTTEFYVITKGSAAALTLAAPTNPGSDGVMIVVTSNTAFAHTITTATLLDTGSAVTTAATFAAFAGASVTFMAYAGRWKVISENEVTFS